MVIEGFYEWQTTNSKAKSSERSVYFVHMPQNDKIKIVSGPIINQDPRRLKKGNIAVPDAFYKVIIDEQLPGQKGIAFLIPHKKSDLPLQNYIISIDSLEEISGIDFFVNQNAEWQKTMEQKSDVSLWPISEARYKLRVSLWNNE